MSRAPGSPKLNRILTIGAHGFDRVRFLDTLIAAGADLFVDIRARRGMRGADYAFANAARLQASLAASGISYIHLKDLAPTDEMRAAQHAADAAAGVPVRQRTKLSATFITEYKRLRLAGFDSRAFAREHLAFTVRPVFFCVERLPEACHRSLLAERIACDLHLPLEHLVPQG